MNKGNAMKKRKPSILNLLLSPIWIVFFAGVFAVSMSSLDMLLLEMHYQVYVAIAVSLVIGALNLIYEVLVLVKKSKLRNSKYTPTELWKILTLLFALTIMLVDKLLPEMYYAELALFSSGIYLITMSLILYILNNKKIRLLLITRLENN